MKKFLALVMILCSLCSFAFANEQHAKSSFEKMAATIIQDLNNSYNRGDYAVVYFDDVYFADGTSGGWLKMGYNSLRSGYAVYPNQNAAAPYIGVIEVANRTIYYCSPENTYGEFKTKEEAERAMNIAEEGHPNHSRYLYLYKNGQWEFASEQMLDYNEQGVEEWMNVDEGWNIYKRMLIQNRWEGFDGTVEIY